MQNKDSWNPSQYKKFEAERNLPFYDLVNLIVPKDEMEIIDLGCGTGKLTKVLHDNLKARHTTGIDTSEAMLEESNSYAGNGLSFIKKNITDFHGKEKYDLIFSNAALQWVPDHFTLFKNIFDSLNEGGQTAIQMPANFDYPTHFIAYELAMEHPFVDELKAVSGYRHILTPVTYSKLLFDVGFERQIVRMQVYPHILESTDSVIEWVKGSLLTYYQSKLSPEMYEQFYRKYCERVINFFGHVRPFFMPFNRILIWGSRSL